MVSAASGAVSAEGIKNPDAEITSCFTKINLFEAYNNVYLYVKYVLTNYLKFSSYISEFIVREKEPLERKDALPLALA